MDHNDYWQPFPRPTVPPENNAKQSGVPVWTTGNNMQLTWAAGPAVTSGYRTIYRQALWDTPIFDHRPDLRALEGVRPDQAQPIWRQGYGSGGQLFIEVTGLQSTGSALTGLRVYAIEYAHPFNPLQLAQIIRATDITADYFGPRTPGTLVPFFPPGSGFPVRYWQVRLVFQYTENHADPTFILSGAYY